MVKFINLETGHVFDGCPPYVFWFENGQSTGLIHPYKIGILSDMSEFDVRIPNNDIFSLLDISKLGTCVDKDSFKYHHINDIKHNSHNPYRSKGTLYENDLYIHVIYFCASSESIGEFVENFSIEKDNDIIGVYNIGADFYNEEESLYINLSNFGVELPESIQKPIYSSNVYEDKKDNILLNRKFKELLVNYWDIIANKGSYKSLINSLNWFEYGDILRLREIWKRDSNGRAVYEDRELTSIMSDKYRDTLQNYTKTTYYALYSRKEKHTGEFDSELNPNIIYTEYKWPIVDMMIKMSLLGYFYETYFMPIHLDLIHSTIEDIVFTNTIKNICASASGRVDNIYDIKNVKCNINDNDEFILSNVNCQVNNSTQFGSIWNSEYNTNGIHIIGVDNIIDRISNEDELKTFYSQLYNGPGCIVPITLSFEIDQMDFVKSQSICFIHDDENDWQTYTQHRIYNPDRSGKVSIEFNLLCTKEKQYDLRFSFETAMCETFVKNVKFNVVDKYTPTINIYKIHPKKNPTIGELNNKPLLYNAISRQLIKNDDGLGLPIYTQYISNSNSSIRLNHMLIVSNDNSQQILSYLNEYYYKLDLSKLIEGKPTSIYISKNFKENDEDLVQKSKAMNIKYIQNKYIFIPQFHYLENFGGTSLESYTIKDETLCCIPDIQYSHNITGYEWIFENISIDKKISLPSIKDAIISNTMSTDMPKGFYNIIFRYSLNDGSTNELRLNSAFVKK